MPQYAPAVPAVRHKQLALGHQRHVGSAPGVTLRLATAPFAQILQLRLALASLHHIVHFQKGLVQRLLIVPLPEIHVLSQLPDEMLFHVFCHLRTSVTVEHPEHRHSVRQACCRYVAVLHVRSPASLCYLYPTCP